MIRPSRKTLTLLALLVSGCLSDGRFILRGPGLPVPGPSVTAPVPGSVTQPATPVPSDGTSAGPTQMTLQGTVVLNGTPLSGAAVAIHRIADGQTLAEGIPVDGQGGFTAALPQAVAAGTILLVTARRDDVILSQVLETTGSLTVQAAPVPAAADTHLTVASTIVAKRLLPKVAEAILTQPAGPAGQGRLREVLTRLADLAVTVDARLQGPVTDDRLRRAIDEVAATPDGRRLDTLSQAMVAYGESAAFQALVEAVQTAWFDNLADGGPAVGPRPWQVGPVRVDPPQVQARGTTQVQVDYQGRSLTVDQPQGKFLEVPAVIAWLERLLGNDAASPIAGGSSGGGGGGGAVTPTPQLGLDAGVTIVDGDATAPVQAGLLVTRLAGVVGAEALAPESGPATTVNLSGPMGLALDSHGNLYVADLYHRRVKRLNASDGQMVTYAGSGTGTTSNGNVTLCAQFNFCGAFNDVTTADGVATAAVLGAPSGLAVDASDNLYISDMVRHCVRKVDAAGMITTVAGTSGTSGFAGDGGSATSARLKVPGGLATDAQGNLYIADSSNHRVRKVTASTGIITTVLGTGTAGSAMTQLNTPTGVAVDLQGNLYVADSLNHRVQKVAAGSGTVTTFAGTTGVAGTAAGVNGDGGLATAGTLYQVSGLAVDRQGTVYISGTGTNAVPNRIRKVDGTTGVISTFVGGGTSTSGVTPLQVDAGSPATVAVDAFGAVYFTDRVKAIVQVVR